jgi:hypothetical protein
MQAMGEGSDDDPKAAGNHEELLKDVGEVVEHSQSSDMPGACYATDMV